MGRKINENNKLLRKNKWKNFQVKVMKLEKFGVERLCEVCERDSDCKIRKDLMEIAVRHSVEFMLTLCDRFEKKESVKLSKKK